jgi:putative secretion ATPase (PEP-CTERM system associated)
MYAEYYKLAAMPFQLTPDSHFFFDSGEHKRALAHLTYGLAQEEGFVVITGEIGAGKTMLVERLWSQLDTGKFVAARVLTTQLSADTLLQVVADGFGLHLEHADKATLLRRLEQLFAETQRAGKRCLLVIDEVQNLPMAAMEELRMLSNLTVHGKAPFQCLLLGQPQFRHTLGDQALEQLRQRILASYHLGPLSPPETRDYVKHRLLMAGWSGDPSFDETTFAAIHERSAGIPRRINTLCSRALLAGFLEETHQITAELVQAIGEELDRDLTAGQPAVRAALSQTSDNLGSLEDRLRSIERMVSRHDRALKLTLEITARLIEAQG